MALPCMESAIKGGGSDEIKRGSMPLELVPEEDMATKSKRTIEKKKIDVVVTKKPIDIEKGKIHIVSGEQIEKIEKEKIEEIEKEKEFEKEKIEKDVVPVPKIIPPANPNVIVKRIYFPDGTYSKKENQDEFKKILENYGFVWVESMMKTYVNKEGIEILTGMYVGPDKNKKVFCIYEGTDMPMTAIVKIVGTGGNFLIDIGSFAHKIGCIIEDKDEIFVNKTMLALQEKGEIYVQKIIEETKIEDFQKVLEEKIQKFIEERLKEYINAYKESFERRGVNIGTAAFFKRKEIEESVRWGLEHGFVKL